MAKNASTLTAQTTVVKQRLAQHAELEKYGDNALPLLGLALYVHADNMEELATEAMEAMTDGSNDKKIDFCHIDGTTQYAVVAQGYTAREWGKQSAPANKASDLITAVGWLFSGSLDQVPEKLRTVAVELRRAIKDAEINRLDFLYIHNCQECGNVENELRTAAKTASDVITNKTGITTTKSPSWRENMTVAEIRKAIEHLPDEALVVPVFHDDPPVHSARLTEFDPDQVKKILYLGIEIYMTLEDEEENEE